MQIHFTLKYHYIYFVQNLKNATSEEFKKKPVNVNKKLNIPCIVQYQFVLEANQAYHSEKNNSIFSNER